jgi:hypothetical protein
MTSDVDRVPDRELEKSRGAAGQYQTFVVRYWTGDPAGPRGHIQHVASGRGLYFRDVERMLQFMDEHLDLPSRATPNGNTTLLRSNLRSNNDENRVHQE